ncbi:MAG: NAD(P)-dependent oxidoreductase [Pseudomonadota bacterium]
MVKLAFLGLGVMGFPMAGHLASAGYEVCVFNRTPSKAQAWVEAFTGSMASTPADAAEGADVVCLCVGNDDDVRQVVLGESGALATMAAGSILIDHTTASATVARELHSACAERQVAFLDAPVSGGQAGAENGLLTVMVGGDKQAFETALPILDVYSRCARHLGPVGSGQLAKMANQICIAGVLQGLSEALLFSEEAGLDSEAVVDVLRQGAAQSWQMENRSATMLKGEYEFGFAVEWMRKDLSIVLAEAERMGLSLELVSQVDGYYAEVEALGGRRWDTSSLFARLRAQRSA